MEIGHPIQHDDSDEVDCCAPKDSIESDWDKMQKLPDNEYLLKTVLPVLYQGMQVVDLQRPNDPLEFLASYILKNMDKIDLPEKKK